MIEKERARRIADEVVTYFLSHHCTQITSQMTFEAEGFYGRVHGPCSEKPDDLAHFIDMLNTPRDITLENYYVELLGGHQTIHEEKDYYLLGTMIDKATITYEDNYLTVSVFRKKYGRGSS
ncbi:hypothetical protein A5886_001043 [Enterococcus sp. 8G7_MSG3316]|uniref:Uncharacterized protein n=1 Tax=Candidatus Enterococcus testudinis TaxID=1834191 RepID=A0A242A4K1_9ENTE|nr:hypothetical protein [Enterococcus sp. 8G7_MSG3316]OTN75967.1 hypothetical protein A5886_001043 [Enterococcus sp. 8G7_MSG3316]